MRTIEIVIVIVLVLVLQTTSPLTGLSQLSQIDFFLIAMVLFVCRLPPASAYAACAAAGVVKDAFVCSPFGLNVLVSILICAALLQLKSRLITERISCRFLFLVAAVLVADVGGWVLARLVCGMDAALPLGLALKRSLIVGVIGALLLSLAARMTGERRMKFASP